MDLLVTSFNPKSWNGLMCRNSISVDHTGAIFDCDFNQQLGLGLAAPRHLRDLLLEDPEGQPIRVDDHCFGCTAGAGSSCGGALEPAVTPLEAAC